MTTLYVFCIVYTICCRSEALLRYLLLVRKTAQIMGPHVLYGSAHVCTPTPSHSCHNPSRLPRRPRLYGSGTTTQRRSQRGKVRHCSALTLTRLPFVYTQAVVEAPSSLRESGCATAVGSTYQNGSSGVTCRMLPLCVTALKPRLRCRSLLSATAQRCSCATSQRCVAVVR